MKLARSLVLSLSLVVPGSLVGCGTASGCPRGYEVFAGMCVPEGSAPDAAHSRADAARGDASFLGADAGVSDAAPTLEDAWDPFADAAVVPPDAAPTLPDAFACPYGPLFGDMDGDGFGDPARVLGECQETLAGWVSSATDCDDGRADAHPGATESCNGVDEDCDGMLDEGATTTFYMDADGDGHGRADHTRQACSVPAGHAASSDDCDDAIAAVFPGASESCNVRDDDCDGASDEGVTTTFYVDADGDTFGRSDRTVQACSVPAGHASRAGDCDDGYAGSSPAALEVCDERDNDCDGVTDELVRTTFHRDADGDGFGDATMRTEACTAPAGYVLPSTDCNDAVASIRPGAPETCNDIDDDCDAMVDDGLARVTYVADCDRDNHTPTGAETVVMCRVPPSAPSTCSGGSWRAGASTSPDCHDGNASVFPGQITTSATAISGMPAGREYDYDCSGTHTLGYTQLAICSGSPATVSGWASSPVPACGAFGAWRTCTSGGAYTTSSVQQRCR